MSETVDDTKSWRRSTFCADTGCVEIAVDGDRILMRDSKDISLPHLSFDRVAWAHFIDEISRGGFQTL
ncbi:DUF397 domain-containing protein [Actinoplanes sp. NPDC026623]|uniref:DUF397 domain-containing protein n=1 Tax=Actinoplanes sp. NPDC026623 TaxID=3155610 RepID=UPI0033CB51F3